MKSRGLVCGSTLVGFACTSLCVSWVQMDSSDVILARWIQTVLILIGTCGMRPRRYFVLPYVTELIVQAQKCNYFSQSTPSSSPKTRIVCNVQHRPAGPQASIPNVQAKPKQAVSVFLSVALLSAAVTVCLSMSSASVTSDLRLKKASRPACFMPDILQGIGRSHEREF